MTDDPERTVTSTSSVSTGAPAALEAGSVLDDRYQIEATIGQGGSGTVFRAWDRVLGEPIAIKILHPARAKEQSWIKRLAREVKVARAIRHPNVCRVFELGHAGGHWFVTMELASGGSLLTLLFQGDKRLLGERLFDARAVCAGLAAIHAVGIIHRDVTPQNVLRMADGRLVLSDFGLAIEATAETTVHGGTPSYMPPEVAMGQLSDQRSDVWQLGMILHEVLFGRRPQWTDAGGVMAMVSPLGRDDSAVEEELERLCRDCLAQTPAARPPSAVAVAGRLAAAEVARPRTPLERAWLRAKNVARRYRTVAYVLGALLALGGVARAVQLAVRPPLCRASQQKLEGIWDMRTKAVVRQAFTGTGRSYASEAFWSVNRIVESYLGKWAAMYTEACEATHVRGEQSAEVLDVRMSCLDSRLGEVRAISQVFQTADAEVVAKAVDAANALRPIDRCGDVAMLRAVVKPPEAPEARRAVQQMRAQLADVKALRDTGRHAEALRRVGVLAPGAQALHYDPLTAEMLTLRAWLNEKTGDYARAERDYAEALAAAEASRDDETAAQAAVELVGMLVLEGLYDEARRWSGLASAILRRLGGHELLQAWLVNDIGNLECGQVRYEACLERFQEAVRLKERALGRDHPDVALSLGNLAWAQTRLGHPAEALAISDRVLAILQRAYGADNPLLALHVSNRGEILTSLGRFDDARATFKRALAIQDRELRRDHPDKGFVLLGLGNAYLAEGHPAQALPFLEQALSVRERGEGQAIHIAEARFALARALWLGGGDRSRARSLAAAAQQAYAELGAKAERESVSRWLAERSP